MLQPIGSESWHLIDDNRISRRVFKMAVQRGRSKRRGESYSALYGEPLIVARTTLADFFNTLLGGRHAPQPS